MIFTKSHQMNSDKKTQYKSYRLYKSLIKDKNKKLQNNYKKMNFQRKNDENFLNEDEKALKIKSYQKNSNFLKFDDLYQNNSGETANYQKNNQYISKHQNFKNLEKDTDLENNKKFGEESYGNEKEINLNKNSLSTKMEKKDFLANMKKNDPLPHIIPYNSLLKINKNYPLPHMNPDDSLPNIMTPDDRDSLKNKKNDNYINNKNNIKKLEKNEKKLNKIWNHIKKIVKKSKKNQKRLDQELNSYKDSYEYIIHKTCFFSNSKSKDYEYSEENESKIINKNDENLNSGDSSAITSQKYTEGKDSVNISFNFNKNNLKKNFNQNQDKDFNSDKNGRKNDLIQINKKKQKEDLNNHNFSSKGIFYTNLTY